MHCSIVCIAVQNEFEAMLQLLATITTGYIHIAIAIHVCLMLYFPVGKDIFEIGLRTKKKTTTRAFKHSIGLFSDFVFMCRKTMAGCSSIIFFFVCDPTLYLLLLAITSAFISLFFSLACSFLLLLQSLS